MVDAGRGNDDAFKRPLTMPVLSFPRTFAMNVTPLFFHQSSTLFPVIHPTPLFVSFCVVLFFFDKVRWVRRRDSGSFIDFKFLWFDTPEEKGIRARLRSTTNDNEDHRRARSPL